MNRLLCWILILLFVNGCTEKGNLPAPETSEGVSQSLATYRKATISHIHYSLDFDIPAEKQQDIMGSETLEFFLKENSDSLQIDFKGASSGIQSLVVNGKEVSPTVRKEHLLIPPQELKRGNNQLQIKFIAGNAALNRRGDYMYTLFVPDRARTAFPCFDQPDLKAIYTLTLHVPGDWQAIANGKLKDSSDQAERKTLHFATSDTISTYLFSFAAGKFKIARQDFRGQEITLLYRETDPEKIGFSMDSVFERYRAAITFYEGWTGIRYPFHKYGMVAIPDFQFGGMEHPGAVLFQSSTLFLDNHATQDQLNNRSNLIAHEMAHMWFGDLVTMKWFSDVWMKEVFANFMADKSTGSAINQQEYDLKFLTSHYPAAYRVDRTMGANPIRQHLDNLQDAGMLYGDIIYHKAPIMMRQLEMLMGKENFQKGVREYLKKYAFGNATWPQLIQILDQETPEDLQSWNKVWVNQTGRPVFDYSLSYAGNTIQQLKLTQHPESGEEKVWPQTFDITLYYAGETKSFPVYSNKETVDLKAVEGLKKPLFILFNTAGTGYGVFPVDTNSLTSLHQIANPVARASAYITLYENMLNGRYLQPTQLLKLYTDVLASEQSELCLKLVTGYVSDIFWEFISHEERSLEDARMERLIWNAMESQTSNHLKKILFQCYQHIFSTQPAFQQLYAIWQKQVPPNGVNLSEEDYTTLACALAVRDSSNGLLLQEQLSRIKNADRIQRFKIMMGALSSKEGIRDQFFNGLSARSNRTNESAIAAALYYLHHPLHQKSSVKYLQKSLDLLEEIQKTGDIFFPASWLQATFSNYQSEEARTIVATFLKAHPNYNPVLKGKILQATDNLKRSQQLVRIR